MIIKVHFFDEEGFMSDWRWYSFKSNGLNSYQTAMKFNIMNPIDHSWNRYLITKEVHTNQFEEFEVDGQTFITIDDGHLWKDDYDGKLYSFESFKHRDEILSKYNTSHQPGFTKATEMLNKISNRNDKITKILDSWDSK